MAQLIVRNLDDRMVARLKQRAAAHGVSAEAEHRSILEQALGTEDAEFWARCDRFRQSLEGRPLADSTALVRESRDRRRGVEE